MMKWLFLCSLLAFLSSALDNIFNSFLPSKAKSSIYWKSFLQTRNSEIKKLNQNFGYHSKEHLIVIDSIRFIDSVNLIKIDNYINGFGYPSIQQFS